MRVCVCVWCVYCEYNSSGILLFHSLSYSFNKVSYLTYLELGNVLLGWLTKKANYPWHQSVLGLPMLGKPLLPHWFPWVKHAYPLSHLSNPLSRILLPVFRLYFGLNYLTFFSHQVPGKWCSLNACFSDLPHPTQSRDLFPLCIHFNFLSFEEDSTDKTVV